MVGPPQPGPEGPRPIGPYPEDTMPVASQGRRLQQIPTDGPPPGPLPMAPEIQVCFTAPCGVTSLSLIPLPCPGPSLSLLTPLVLQLEFAHVNGVLAFSCSIKRLYRLFLVTALCYIFQQQGQIVLLYSGSECCVGTPRSGKST
jgi:hypothetical protein